MSSLGRLGANLGWIVLLTLVLVTYAVVQWVGGALFQDNYEIRVPLSQTGGLFTNQEVTVLGYGVGQVKDTLLTDEGVEVILDIRGNAVVPQDAVVQVLRRSAVGEQAINFIPVDASWEPEGDFVPSEIEPAQGWEAADRGTIIQPRATTYPTEVPQLLAKAIDLFEAVDKEDLGTLVHELADAVGGRAELLKELSRDSLDLNTTLVAGIPEFERLLDTSGPLLEELNEHRDSLAAIFPDFADVSETLAAERPTLERIIDHGTVALREGEAFVVNTRANQDCLMEDFTALNRMISQPENLNDLSRGLRDSHWFFQDGFDVITQWDPYRPGVAWQRVNFLMFEEFGGQDYVPDRPTPQTKPGAACVSPWGVGVNAVRQADHQPPDPTAPAIDFAPLVEGQQEQRPATRGTDGSSGAPDAGSRGTDRGALPATGGGLAGVIAPLALGFAWIFRRHR